MARMGSVVAGVAAVTFALAGVAASPASAAPRGVFVAKCRYSHSLRDDPIVHPGDPGASHRHDFFANTSTNALSTASDMLASTTSCPLRKDTAGYWFPTGYLDGTRLVPTFAKIYYFGQPQRPVEVPPRGLQIVAGLAAAASAAGNPHVSWSCGAKRTKRTPIVDHPYDCTRFARRWRFVDSVVGRVDLPSCWDGRDTTPHDVVYLDDRACPDGFEHRLPDVRMQIHYGILDPCRPRKRCSWRGTGANVLLALSSGPYYTFHADLWNTWHQHMLTRLVRRCLDDHVACGTVSDARPFGVLSD